MANNVFQVKRTSTSGRTPNTTGSYATNSQYIAAGEFALNMVDGVLYTSNGSAVITVGSNLVNQRITNSVSIDNNKNIRFQTINTAAYVGMRQQNDDNFVFYSTNTAYGERAIWSVFANSITSAFSLSSPTIFNAGVNLGQVSLTANGTAGTAGQVLTSNGTATYWSTVTATVSTSAQYTWSNLHTFQANVSFTGNGIGITTNTGAIYLGGLADNNWKIGRNTGSTTKWRYTNNSIDIITANSNLEGMSIGLINGNSYFETGYLGTFIASNVTIGNTTVNVTINSTSFTGTASNASLLNNKTEGNLNVNNATTAYGKTEGNLNVNNATTAYSKAESALNVNSALTANNSTNLGGQAAASYALLAGPTFTGTVNVSSGNFYSNNLLLQGDGTNAYIRPINSGSVLYLGANNNNHLSLVANGNLGIGNTAPAFKLRVDGTTSLAGAVSGITTLGAGNTTITGFANVTTTIQGGSSLTIAGALSGVTTAAMGNTTITGFANVTTSVNSALLTVGSTFIANTSQLTTTVPFSANGATGTAGHVLTSNGATGSPYWAAAAGGGYYKGGTSAVGSLAVGGQNLFRVNANTLNTSTTFVAGENGSATGPITIASGITLTIQTGARVSIV